MRTMKLNNREFEVIIPRTTSNLEWYERILSTPLKDLYDFMATPSAAKQEIWEEWQDWYSTLKSVTVLPIKRLSVSGANCMSFSLVGVVNVNFEDYIIYITKGHNRLIKVV